MRHCLECSELFSRRKLEKRAELLSNVQLSSMGNGSARVLYGTVWYRRRFPYRSVRQTTLPVFPSFRTSLLLLSPEAVQSAIDEVIFHFGCFRVCVCAYLFIKVLLWNNEICICSGKVLYLYFVFNGEIVMIFLI